MVNEALILEENKAQRPSDIDVIWSYGYGWPEDTGGPMAYGDIVGAENLSTMQALKAENDAIQIAPTLEKLAAEGGRFVDLDLGGLKTGELRAHAAIDRNGGAGNMHRRRQGQRKRDMCHFGHITLSAVARANVCLCSSGISSVIPVWIGLRQTAFTVMPSLPSSTANPLVRPIMPCLAAV